MHFTRALVRPPAATFAGGITSSGLGPPDLPLALRQHDQYCFALESLGVTVARLDADPAFPDSTFVEDAAIVTGRGAIITRPGAPSRAGETTAIRAALRPWFPEPAEIAEPGTVDGGDVCEAGEHFFIGRSHRTNRDGVTQLVEWLSSQGYGSSIIDIRPRNRLLHLKTGLAWLGGRRLLATGELAEPESFDGWEVVRVPDGEEYAGNCVLVNGGLLVPDGFPLTQALVEELGFRPVRVDTSEFQKMDGGLSCLSIRW